MTGPYENFAGNPILTQRYLPPDCKNPVTCAGHADIVETRNGEWWAVFLACRPYEPGRRNNYNTGRETFLAPVEWIDGWPIINPEFELVHIYGGSNGTSQTSRQPFLYNYLKYFAHRFQAECA